jgi:prepilin-type N-terminal cleavage/methylation domain-containing protein
MRGSRSHAFTLLELLLVIAVLGMMLAFAWPNLSGTTHAEQLSESTKRMETLVAMCRAEAMNEGRHYRIVFRADGSVRAKCQLDPLKAPHIYIPAYGGWTRTEVLLDNVWVAAVQMLPDGPAPIMIVDEHLQFPNMEIDPTPIEDFEQPPAIEFQPDGACDSVRWVLRDDRGDGRLMTLDGRLGRVTVEEFAALRPEGVRRPPPLSEEAEKEDQKVYKVEDFE